MANTQKLLLIDDEPVIQHAFRKAFHPPEYETITARTAAEGLARLESERPDVVVLDVHLPDADGLQAFKRIKAVDSRTPVILITGHGTTELAIQGMKEGAFEYLLKPLRYEVLHELIAKACETSRLMHVPAVFADEPASGQVDPLIGSCPAMQEIYKQVGRVASTDETVLLLGESGTGKELIARAIYQHGNRASKAFLAINCGAIPENLMESELFGHERGAFTGADTKRIGKFEQSDGGTIFLDEIGEMPLLAQVKLLRLLQEQKFERVGGKETVKTDVRVIAATNANLEDLVEKGLFRRDLYFRLKVFTIQLPPLRERGNDLDLMIDHFIKRFRQEFGRPVSTIPEETRAALHKYPWPGNVRELQSVLKQAILKLHGSVLLVEDLFLEKPKTEALGRIDESKVGQRLAADWEDFIAERLQSGTRDLYAECLATMEKQLFTKVLQMTQGNQLKASEILGITRGTLRIKLKALGITIEKMVWTGSHPTG